MSPAVAEREAEAATRDEAERKEAEAKAAEEAASDDQSGGGLLDGLFGSKEEAAACGRGRPRAQEGGMHHRQGRRQALHGWSVGLPKNKRQNVSPENRDGVCGTPGRTQSIS